MKVGVIGPQQLVSKITQVIKQEFPQFEAFSYVYSDFTDTPRIIRYHQPELDALLFAGKTPFTLASKVIRPAVPWEYIPRSGSSLLRILLHTKLSTDYDICNISFDTYSLDLLYEAYAEIGIPRDRLRIFAADEYAVQADYQDYVCAFHAENYSRNRVSCCITALGGAYQYLTDRGIPALMIEPTNNVIRETLNKLQLKYLVQVSQQSQLVAICVRIDTPSEHSLLDDSDYQGVIDRMKVAEQIYLYAQKIQAAVIETDSRNYLLFSTRQMLESETNDLKNIDLLKSVRDSTSSTVSVGVGYGKTAREVKHGAHLGVTRASKRGGNLAYIVYDGKKIIGPVKSAPQETKDAERLIDERFLRISEKVGVSVNTVFRIHCIVEQHGQGGLTGKELAALLGVTARTVNRLVEKFEVGGFVKTVGRRVIGGAGRPSRIIRICFDSQ